MEKGALIRHYFDEPASRIVLCEVRAMSRHDQYAPIERATKTWEDEALRI